MSEVTYKWINGEVPEGLEIKQVYGIVFDEYFNLFKTDLINKKTMERHFSIV